MKIVVRYDLPVFSRSSVMAYFGRNGFPKGFREPLRWEDIRKLKKISDPKSNRIRSAYDLFSTVSVDFEYTSFGLYLTDEGRSMSGLSMKNQCEKMGRFVSEGLSNHIHLSGLINNPVAQFEIGCALSETGHLPFATYLD